MKIKVEPLYPTGNYLNCRIGLEIETHDNVNIEQEVNQLWDCITAIHMKRYPHLYNEDGTAKYEMYKGEEMKGTHVRNVVEEPQDKIERTMIEEMEACSSYPEIQSFRFTIKDADEQAVYDRKLNELSPKNQ